MRAELESQMERTEMRMIRWMCRVSLKERQPITELRCLGVGAIGDVMRRRQTEEAVTSGKKGRRRLQALGWWCSGRHLSAGRGRPGRTLRLPTCVC